MTYKILAGLMGLVLVLGGVAATLEGHPYFKRH